MSMAVGEPELLPPISFFWHHEPNAKVWMPDTDPVVVSVL